MPKKTVTIDVDENLLVVASNECKEFFIDDELMSADEDGNNGDIRRKKRRIKTSYTNYR